MYLLSYFRTDHNPTTRHTSEALHYALSADGYSWKALNGDKPVLCGTVGTKTLRDPFIIQSNDGLFHLLSTNGWEAVYILHAWSDDLITWSPQELIPVMSDVPGALNAWAPECFFDREAKVYRLIWSATTSPSGQDEDLYQRCWSCSTSDFRTFSRSEIFFDPGYSIIDACVQPQGESYLMAFKDERGENAFGTHGKAIQMCSFSTTTGEWSELSELFTPTLTEGPALFVVEGEWRLISDHFLEGKMGAMSSTDG
ncbi:MAG: hypothetical protein EOO38_15080 [Cytophagaceae bacterium]|nr:MAG: hypothetical protein EOO38_15080 [Cytophagaceae bacterium]